MENNNMDLPDNEIFRLGMEAGRKQLADHIQHQFEIGKPVEINGELYWLTDSRQHLIDVMDGIESEWKAEQGLKKFIIPIRMMHTKGEVVREVIIETDNAKTAMLIAIGDFQHNGWIVDKDFNSYKRLE